MNCGRRSFLNLGFDRHPRSAAMYYVYDCMCERAQNLKFVTQFSLELAQNYEPISQSEIPMGGDSSACISEISIV